MRHQSGHMLTSVPSAVQDAFRAVTGLPISTYFSAFKWAWLLEHSPAVAAARGGGLALRGPVGAGVQHRAPGTQS